MLVLQWETPWQRLDGWHRRNHQKRHFKVKSGQVVVHTPKELSHGAMKFVPSIITVPRSDEIVEPENIHQAPSIPETLSIQKFVRQINDRGDCCIELFMTLIGTTKLVVLFAVKRSPIKEIARTVYRRREWMVTMSHLWTMFSRSMFLRLNLI